MMQLLQVEPNVHPVDCTKFKASNSMMQLLQVEPNVHPVEKGIARYRAWNLRLLLNACVSLLRVRLLNRHRIIKDLCRGLKRRAMSAERDSLTISSERDST